MKGETDLNKLINSMSPILEPSDYVFYSSKSMGWGEIADIKPKAVFEEQEGLSIIIDKDSAIKKHINYDQTYKCITLNVHSSLEAVGLTAAVSDTLKQHGISANVVAAYYHDHIFVNSKDAHMAMTALVKLSQQIQ